MGKVAIVTGASSGIGAATVLALAERGVDAIVTFSRNEEGAIRLVEEVGKKGARAIPLHLDVGRSSTFAEFRATVAGALEREWQVGTIDYLVNNAGFGGMAFFEDTSEEQFDEFMRVILKGPYFLTQALLPLMVDGGAIVNVTSNSALPTGVEPGYSAYATMKGGLAILSRYMAKEFSKRRIRVNAVAPGPTRTRIGGDAFEKYPEVIAPLVERTALGRLGEPGDVGSAIASLLSDDLGWITGQHIEVSGGFRM